MIREKISELGPNYLFDINVFFKMEFDEKLLSLKNIISSNDPKVRYHNDQVLNVERYYVEGERESYILEFEESNAFDINHEFLSETCLNKFKKKVNTIERINKSFFVNNHYRKEANLDGNTQNYLTKLYDFQINRRRETEFLFEKQFKDSNFMSIGCIIYKAIGHPTPFSDLINNLRYEDFFQVISQVFACLALTQVLLPQFMHNNLISNSIHVINLDDRKDKQQIKPVLRYFFPCFNLTFEIDNYIAYLVIDKTSSASTSDVPNNRYYDLYTLKNDILSKITSTAVDHGKKTQLIDGIFKLKERDVSNISRIAGRYCGHREAIDIMYTSYLNFLINQKIVSPKEQLTNEQKTLIKMKNENELAILKDIVAVQFTNSMLRYLSILTNLHFTNDYNQYQVMILKQFFSENLQVDLYKFYYTLLEGIDSMETLKKFETNLITIFYIKFSRNALLKILDDNLTKSVAKIVPNVVNQVSFFNSTRFYSLKLKQYRDLLYKDKLLEKDTQQLLMNTYNELLSAKERKRQSQTLKQIEEINRINKKLKTKSNEILAKNTFSYSDVPSFDLDVVYHKNEKEKGLYLEGSMKFYDSNISIKQLNGAFPFEVHIYTDPNQKVEIKIEKDEKELQDFSFEFNEKTFKLENGKLTIPIDIKEDGVSIPLILKATKKTFYIHVKIWNITPVPISDRDTWIQVEYKDLINSSDDFVNTFTSNKSIFPLCTGSSHPHTDSYSPGPVYLFKTSFLSLELQGVSLEYQFGENSKVTNAEIKEKQKNKYEASIDFFGVNTVYTRLSINHKNVNIPMMMIHNDTLYNGHPLQGKTVFFFEINRNMMKSEKESIKIYFYGYHYSGIEIEYKEINSKTFDFEDITIFDFRNNRTFRNDDNQGYEETDLQSDILKDLDYNFN